MISPGRYRVRPKLTPGVSYTYVVRAFDGKLFARCESTLRNHTWDEARGMELTPKSIGTYTWERIEEVAA